MNKPLPTSTATEASLADLEMMTQLQQLKEFSRKIDQTTCETKADAKTLLSLMALLDRPDAENLELAKRLASTLAAISDSMTRQEAMIEGQAARLLEMQETLSERLDALDLQMNRQSDLLEQLFEPEDGDTS